MKLKVIIEQADGFRLRTLEVDDFSQHDYEDSAYIMAEDIVRLLHRNLFGVKEKR